MRRIRPPGVTPLEVWNTDIDGRSLFSWQDDEQRFPSALAQVARRLAESGHAFDHIYLTGGGTARPGVREALESAGFTVTVAGDPIFSAVRAAPALIRSRRALCVDIGQTSLKLYVGDYLFRVKRDLTRMPLRIPLRMPLRMPLIDTIAPAALPAARASTIASIGAILRETAAVYRPPVTVLAMPCAVDDALVAADCSYAWASHDPTLLDEIITIAGLDSARVFVLNDAELAAFAASRDNRIPPDTRILTLTLGYGVGAALGTTGSVDR